MSRTRRWLLIAVTVTLAAFVSGIVRGLTDTVPIELQQSPAPASTTSELPEP